MKLGIVSITALLIATGLVNPVRADVQCQGFSAVRICLDETNLLSDRRADYDDDDYDDSDINQIYREVLGRNVDRRGLQTYNRKLDRGQSLDSIRTDIAESREARNVVEDIYRQLVGRSADRDTVRDYTRRLARGWTLSDVRADIVGSDEFRSREGFRSRGRNDEFRDRGYDRRPPIAPRADAPLPPAVGPSRRPPIAPPPGGPRGLPPIAPPAPVRPY